MLPFILTVLVAQVDPGLPGPPPDAVAQALPQVGAGGVLGLLAGGGPLALLARSLYARLEKAEDKVAALDDRLLRLELGTIAELKVLQAQLSTIADLVRNGGRP